MKKKKYQELKDLTHLRINVIEVLDDDFRHEKKLVKAQYLITSNGGRNIMWEVQHETYGTVVTVSTGEQRKVSVGNGINVPEYKHYVLTDEGIRYIKQEVVAAAI